VRAPAEELAALYQERLEIENALDEFKTHLRGARIVLRSKRPDLFEQEFYGFMPAHFAIRGLMHEAALNADQDPDPLSYVHAVRVVRRKLPHFVALPPLGHVKPFIKPCSMRYWASGSSLAGADATHEVSNGR